jgi:hypothetical protein
MKTKLLLTLGLAGVVAFGIQVAAAQSQSPALKVHELPNYEDIPWCRDLPKDSGEEYCLGGPEGFQGHWFVGADK